MFALVDVNNFYASCERLFRPDLKDRPVIVLSNNDGCVVARSKEAKQLGIKMGEPLFKIKHLVRKHQVVIFSSNYAFYADISSRVMSTLERLAPMVEVYSIDEAFLGLDGFYKTICLESFGREIKKKIDGHIGVPVCVGIAPTKTLAKLANYAAKHYPATDGVVELTNRQRQRKLMSLVPTKEIWGIGSRLSHRLSGLGIFTALDFADAPATLIRRHSSVQLLRTQRELNGERCFDLASSSPAKQQIICSRSFSQRVTEFTTIQQAICEYTSRAAEKLRLEKRLAKQVMIFIRTSGFNKQEPHYSNSATTNLCYPSDDTRHLIHAATGLISSIWKPGYRYSKAGVMLMDFYEADTIQLDLFEPIELQPKNNLLMSTIDRINHSGLGKIFFAGQGIKKDWIMKRDLLSPCYTTRWNDIPIVR